MTVSPLLALDARNFAHVENAELQLGTVEKSVHNPLFREDFFADPPKRWEARFDNVYPSVIYDEAEGVFKCWYKSFIVDEASVETPLAGRPRTRYTGGKREEGLLYAISNDGVHWEKPALGLIEFEGSRANNIVMRRATHGIHAGGVLKDPRDPDPARRYKFIHRNPRAHGNLFFRGWSALVPAPALARTRRCRRYAQQRHLVAGFGAVRRHHARLVGRTLSWTPHRPAQRKRGLPALVGAG